MITKPRSVAAGEIACLIDRRLLADRAELALTVALMCNRRLFGQCYLGLQPDYFDAMPRDSGVLVCPIVPTRELAPTADRPGDVDLLVVPYEGDDLIVGRTLAIEIKAVRALFTRQGRSPNDYGFSQASALLDLGFPHVALAHLIVSDKSPAAAWRGITAVKVLDAHGRTTAPFDLTADMMPGDLIERAFGRLEANAPRSDIGLLAAYLDSAEFDRDGRSRRPALWIPEARAATRNLEIDEAMLDRVAGLYEHHSLHFLQIPRF